VIDEQLDVEDIRSNSKGFARDFEVTLRLSDPRYYLNLGGAPQTVALTTTNSPVTNNGNAPTDPVVTISGTNNPSVVNASLPGNPRIAFNGVDVSAPGDELVIDFANRTALKNGSNDVRNKIDLENSAWWDAGVPGLVPGVNQIRVGDTGATGEIEFYHAYYS